MSKNKKEELAKKGETLKSQFQNMIEGNSEKSVEETIEEFAGKTTEEKVSSVESKKAKKVEKMKKTKEADSSPSPLQSALSAVGKTEKDIFINQDKSQAIKYVGNYVSITTVNGKHLYLDLKNCVEVTRRAVYPKKI